MRKSISTIKKTNRAFKIRTTLAKVSLQVVNMDKVASFAKEYPNWEEVKCTCHNGIKTSVGHYPKECSRCSGSGYIYRHKKSGVLAEYPGGRLLGQTTKKEN